jgi:hypothetical protein
VLGGGTRVLLSQNKEKENSVKTLEEEEVRLLVQHVPTMGSSDDLVTTALRKLIENAQARRRASLPGHGPPVGRPLCHIGVACGLFSFYPERV